MIDATIDRPQAPVIAALAGFDRFEARLASAVAEADGAVRRSLASDLEDAQTDGESEAIEKLIETRNEWLTAHFYARITGQKDISFEAAEADRLSLLIDKARAATGRPVFHVLDLVQ